MGETNVDWQWELEMEQFVVEQSWEDCFWWIYEGGIAWIEEEVVQPDLVWMVP